MGAFSSGIRSGTIAGPNKREFCRSQFEEVAQDPSSDDADRQAAITGLYFDVLLSFIRDRPYPKNIPGPLFGPLAIAITNVSYIALLREYRLVSPASAGKPSAHERLALKQPRSLDQPASLDERVTALGDGLKYALMKYFSEGDFDAEALPLVSRDEILEVRIRLTDAVNYHVVSDYYNECRASSLALVATDRGATLAPVDEELECLRVVTGYRRALLANQHFDLFLRAWQQLAHREKEELCGITPVQRVLLSGHRVAKIELGRSETALDASIVGIHAKLRLLTEINRDLLADELAESGGVVVFTLVLAWQFLQSLSEAIFARLQRKPTETPSEILAACAMMPRALLLHAMAASLNIAEPEAMLLMNALTFSTKRARQLWTRPLVRCGDEYGLVIPCIRAVSPDRLLERWMQEGGIDMDRRGVLFERFARRRIFTALELSPLREALKVLPHRLRLNLQGGQNAELDIVVVLHDVILLIDCKCLIWHEDALEFADYRLKLEKAADQVARQLQFCNSNKDALIHKLHELSCPGPEITRLLGCVLINSASLAGTCIQGVPIIELALLEDFLAGEYVLSEQRAEDRLVRRDRVALYDSTAQAAEFLEEFLRNPPQLLPLKQSAERREISVRLTVGQEGRFLHETFQLNPERIESSLPGAR